MSQQRELESKGMIKINPAVQFSVSRYVLAIGFFLAIVVFGLVSTVNLGVDLFPSTNVPVVMIQTTYTGASPEVVDVQVTQIIENTVSTLSGITDMNSSSSTGSSRVILQFELGTDKNAAMNQVASLMATAIRRLPVNVTAPTVRTFDPNAQPILQFGIIPTSSSMAEVADYAQNTDRKSTRLNSSH